MNLSFEERDRYSRQMVLDGIGEAGQLKLKASRVLVVGAGGLGCPALMFLTGAGVGTIGVADGDQVQVSNLHRQVLYGTGDIGQDKATCAVERLKQLNSFVTFHAHNQMLISEHAIELIRDYDIILDCTDNYESRYMINDACVLCDKVLVYGAVFKMDGQASVFNYNYSDGKRGATYRCVFPEPVEPSYTFSCSETGVLGVLPGIIGTIQATETIKIITGKGTALSNRLLMVNGADMKFSEWSFVRDESKWNNFPSSAKAFTQTDYSTLCKPTAVNEISMEEWINDSETEKLIQVVDVREPNEFENYSWPGSVNIPAQELIERRDEISENTRVLFVCQSGTRSALIINMLGKYRDISYFYSLKGGLRSLHQVNEAE